MSEEFTFDKFMDDIIIKERKRVRSESSVEELTPQQKYARQHTERAANRTYVGKR